jgi:DNA-binding NarL/FixJ family response regulator
MSMRAMTEAFIRIGYTAAEDDRPIRVVVIDDHPVICEALSAALDQEEDMECCGTAGRAGDAIALVEQCKPDVAVVDISLGDAHGLTLVQEIRSTFPNVQVVIYSMSHEAAYAERAIRAGALGYVAKGESSRSVVEAIRTVFTGRVYLNKSVASRMLNKVVKRNGTHSRAGIDRLTDQELAVFQMLGQAHSVPEIAERLGVSQKTVVAYRRRAKEKLGLDSVGKLVQQAFQWTQGITPQAAEERF